MPHGQTAGYLGKTYDPFVLNSDPSVPDLKVPDILPPDYIAAVRVDHRRSWRSAIDQSVSYFESNQDARLMNATFSQAYTLMSSAKAREAFELRQEPDAVRQRYGKNRFGQACLLARRLIERDVRFVTINMFETVFNEITWDIHGSAPFSPITLIATCWARCSTTPTARSSRTYSSADCSRLRSCWPWVSSGGRRRSIPPAGATTGRNAGRLLWPVAGSRVGRWWARQTRLARRLGTIP